MNNRALRIEDAVSPLIERAKIALGTFEQRSGEFFAPAHYNHSHTYRPVDGQEDYCDQCATLADEWAAILAEGHPTRAEIRTAFRGRGLGSVGRDEVRAIIIRAMLRDTPEMGGVEYGELPPQQQLARTVTNWIMAAFDDACWMTEEEAEDLIVAMRPHTIAG